MQQPETAFAPDTSILEDDTMPGLIDADENAIVPSSQEIRTVTALAAGHVWAVDSGSSLQKVNSEHRDTRRGPERMLPWHERRRLQTVQGVVEANTIVPTATPVGNRHCIPLPDTQDILSLGRLCTDEGFSFSWSAGSPPVLRGSTDEEVPLTVVDNVPTVSGEGSNPQSSNSLGLLATNIMVQTVNSVISDITDTILKSTSLDEIPPALEEKIREVILQKVFADSFSPVAPSDKPKIQ